MGIKTNNEIWVWIEERNKKIMGISLEALGKAIELKKGNGCKVASIIIGENVDELAKDCISYGSDKVYQVSDPKLKHYNSGLFTRIIYDLAKDNIPNILLLGANSIGMDLAPTVAVKFETGLTAHCSDLYYEKTNGEKQLIATVPGYSGGMVVKIVCPEKRPEMITVSAGVGEKPTMDPDRQGEIIKVDFKPEEKDDRITTIEMVEKEPLSMPVEGAVIVVTGGRGMKETEGVELVRELCDSLGAAMGGTRPAIENGWVEQENLIGASGKTVSPKLFISIGANGATHYTAGFDKADYVLAIDNNPKAPIFQVCDLGIVDDLYKIVPPLIEEINKNK